MKIISTKARAPNPDTQENTTKSKISKEKYDKQRDQFLITFNNPLKYGYSHEQIKEILHKKFKHLQFYCMADELSTTETPHTHLYILLTSKKCWSAVQNAFKHAHIEEEVRGSPQQVVHYIKKDADNLTDEKRETSVPGTYEEWGSIPEVLPNASRNEILLQIQDLIDQDYRLVYQGICQSLGIEIVKDEIKGPHSFRRNAITDVINSTNGNAVLASSLFGNSPDVARKNYYTGVDLAAAKEILDQRKIIAN